MGSIQRGFRQLCLVLTPLFLLASVMIAWSPVQVGASSHREAPLISSDPTADNTDVYAFVSPDAPTTVTMIANWIPFEEPGGGPNFYHFDDNVDYYIRIDQDGDGVEDISYEWNFHTEIKNGNTFLYNTGPINSPSSSTFNYTQYYTVTQILGSGASATETVLFANRLMVPDNIGPRSTPNYETLAAQFVNSANGIKEFSGQRSDPFFVDVNSIFDLLGLRPFNNLHTIPLPVSPGLNSTAGYNIHTTAIQVPIKTLAPGCQGDKTSTACVIGIWSTAERPKVTTLQAGGAGRTGSGPRVQVSRLGNPLVNEVVIPLALKDAFNSIPPSTDSTLFNTNQLFRSSVLTPELALLIKQLYAPAITQIPATPRTDLVTVFLTGIPGINAQKNSAQTPSDQLRLNVAIAPTAGICQGNRLAAMAGDLGGFPNGRRIEDDITDIAIRAEAGGYGTFLNQALGLPNLSPNNVLGDGVDKPDKPCLSSFPYVPTPAPGYSRVHAAITTNFLSLIAQASTAR